MKFSAPTLQSIYVNQNAKIGHRGENSDSNLLHLSESITYGYSDFTASFVVCLFFIVGT